MKILHYNALDTKRIPNYKKVTKAIGNDDFTQAQVKKIGDNLYRAKLNRQDRLLFSLYAYQDETYALMLEWIKNHDYDKSRFINRSVQIDDDLVGVPQKPPKPKDELTYVNPEHQDFAWLGKCISFDNVQQAIYQTDPPLIIVGSAGSGKTALVLEKLKKVEGDVLYVSLSSYLVKNAHDLYYSGHYCNDAQKVDFFSYQELLESIAIPEGNPIDFLTFRRWFNSHRKGSGIKDAHKLFEEIRGVLTSVDTNIEDSEGYLSFEDYQNLGVRQSIYLDKERKQVYQLFQRYLQFVAQSNQLGGGDERNSDSDSYYDINLTSHAWLNKIKPTYDFVVVDEVQDFTSIQLYLILKTLNQSGQFLLSGDANQIVHPNFFSWTKLKQLFYHQKDLQGGEELVRILHTNYRNTPAVTNIANRILQLKNLRFGSIDKESHYLVDSNSQAQGNAILWQDKDELVDELNQKTRRSTQFAVIVLHDSQKAVARKKFNTPLIFSVQEAKGLEYENVILYNFVSSEEVRFSYIAEGVDVTALDGKMLDYSRNKDKTDKSFEVYKFYINALYVALTRAVKNVYWIESRHKHPLFSLLKVAMAQSDSLDIEDNESSIEDWQLEAQKLAMQGKTEQAEQIRTEVLHEKAVNWTVYNQENLEEVIDRAIADREKKSGILLLEYAQVYNQLNYYYALKFIELKAAQRPLHHHHKALLQKHYYTYTSNNTKNIEKQIDEFGLEYRDRFNRTPLMNAVWVGNIELVKRLIERGADIEAVDNQGDNALRIALQQSISSFRELKTEDSGAIDNKAKYAEYVLPEIYELIAPRTMSLQTKGRLVKIELESMMYWLVNIMLTMLPNALLHPTKNAEYYCPMFQTKDILQAIKFIPLSILPKYRRRRAYISSVLSSNEIEKEGRYNQPLFYRVERGKYLLYPKIKIKRQNKWHSVINIEDYHLGDSETFKLMLWSQVQDKKLIARIPNLKESSPF